MESGRKNTDEYKAALQLLFGDKLPKNLEKSLARVKKYVVDDNTSAQKIVSELNNYGYIKTNKNGQKIIDIDNLSEAANKMKITEEALVALLGEVNEFVQVDFNFSTDFDYWLDKLKEAGKVHIEGDQVKILVDDYKELADVLGTTQSQAEKFAEYTNGLGDYTIDIKYSDGEENKQSLQDSIKTVEDLNKQVDLTNDAMNQLSKTQVSDFGMKNTNNVFKNTITLVQNLIGKVRTLNTELNKADTKVEKVSDKTDSNTTTTTSTSTTPGTNMTNYLSGSTKKGKSDAQGTMGATKDEKALVGELGEEILARNGHFYVLGNKGAEFVNIKKNDIIFNHKQTAELLKKGYTLSRGKSLAQGNAYYTGNTSASSGDVTGLLTGGNKSSTKKKKKKSSSRDKDKDTSKAKDAFSEVIDWIEIKLEKFAKNTEKLVKRIDKYISYINANKAVDTAMTAVKSEKNVNQQAYNKYMQKANSVGLSSTYKKKVQNGQINIQTIKDEKLKEKIDEYQKWYEKAQACKDTIAELNEQLTELAQKKLENITDWFDTRVSYKDARKNVYETSIAYREAQGKRGTDNQYKGLVDNNKSKQAVLQNEYKKTTEQLNALVKAGSIKKYSKEWYEWQDKLREIQADINDCKTETIDLKKQWLDAKLTAFDKAIEKCTDLQDELSDIIDLMNSDTFFNESGKLTEDGFTYIGMVGQQLASAKQEVLKYADEISYINEEYAKFKKGQNSLITSEDDYNNRIKEVTENQREAAKAVKDYRDALIDLKVKGIEAEIEALKELAEKNKELLNEEKNRDDYEKSIQDKTKSIDILKRQIAELELSDNRKDKAELKKLKKQLADAQEELAQTEKDHNIEMQEKAIDDAANAYEEKRNNEIKEIQSSYEKQSAIIADYLDDVKDNYKNVFSDITEIAEIFGVTLTSELKKPWQDAKSAIDEYKLASQELAELNKKASTTANTNTNTAIKNSINTIKNQNNATLVAAKRDDLFKKIENLQNLQNNPIVNGGLNTVNNVLKNLPNTKSSNNAIKIGTLMKIEGNTDEKLLNQMQAMCDEVPRKLASEIKKL